MAQIQAVAWFKQGMRVAARINEKGEREVYAWLSDGWNKINCTDEEWETIIKPKMEAAQCQVSNS